MTTIRRGISLVEILVVIGIIALLLAILIPAVQRSREAARKTTCQNNLRQQALAVQTFESAHRALPSLYNGTFLKLPRTVMYEFHSHSWRTAILPQLELGSLYRKIDQSLPPTVASNQDNLNVGIATFKCPSTSNPAEIVPDILGFNDGKALTINNGKVVSTIPVGTAARADYEVVGGFYFDPAPPETPQTGPLRGTRFGAWGEPKYDVPDHNGKALSYRVARFRDIADGLSNTLLITELAGRPDSYLNGELDDAYPPDDPDTGMDIHAAAWGISTHIVWLLGYQGINKSNHRGTYSFHESGANVAFADGSVKFLSEQTSTETLAAMSTRAAGDIVNHQ